MIAATDLLDHNGSAETTMPCSGAFPILAFVLCLGDKKVLQVLLGFLTHTQHVRATKRGTKPYACLPRLDPCAVP